MPETTDALLTEQATAWKRILDHASVARTSDVSLPKATFGRRPTAHQFWDVVHR